MDVANRGVVSDDQVGKLPVVLVIEQRIITGITDLAHIVQSQRFKKSNDHALPVPVLVAALDLIGGVGMESVTLSDALICPPFTYILASLRTPIVPTTPI
jgi:hypothetical protein